MRYLWDVFFLGTQVHRNVCNAGGLQEDALGGLPVKCEADICTVSLWEMLRSGALDFVLVLATRVFI